MMKMSQLKFDINVRFTKQITFEEVEKYIDGFIDEVIDEAKTILKHNNNIATGNLIGSDYKERIDINTWEFGFSAPYGGYVELGTAPRIKYPPIEKIKNWLMVKYGVPEENAWKSAWRVATHIKKHGTKPYPFFRPAIYSAISRRG